MLCRTADDLYWLARHIERAENTARLIDVTRRIALLPDRFERGRAQSTSWRRALEALGADAAFEAKHGKFDPDAVLRYLTLDPDNPSSVISCLRAARESARAQRTAITAEMYEDLNASWIDARQKTWEQLRDDGTSAFVDWVKSRSASFRGVTIGTLGRGAAYRFMSLGTFIERADWAIRLLDIKSSGESAGDAVDYYQWSALLHALSAFESYRQSHRDALTGDRVIEHLLLSESNPRSLAACLIQLHRVLSRMASDPRREVVRQAGALASEVRYATIAQIRSRDLEAYLQDVMSRLVQLGREIHREFMDAPDEDRSE